MNNLYIDKDGYFCIEGDEWNGEKKYKVNSYGLLKEVIEGYKYTIHNPHTPVETKGFSPRTLNALFIADILSIEKLNSYSEKELRQFKGIGNKAINELKEYLN